MQPRTVVIQAKYRSTCAECRGAIAPGDSLTKRGDKWVHVTCPTPRESTLTFQRSIPAGPTPGQPLPPYVQSPAGDNPFSPSPSPDSSSSDPSPAGGDQRVFTPDEHQLALINHALHSPKNLVGKATAGSGKSTTAFEIIRRIPKNKSWIYLVFASRNRKEAQGRLDGFINGEVHTYHSYCRKQLANAYGKFIIDEHDDKVFQAIKSISNRDEKELWSLAAKVVSLFQNTLIDPNDNDAVESMLDHHSVDLNGSQARVLEIARGALKLCRDNKSLISFDDMVYLAAVENIPLEQYDYVIIDEVQDSNKTNIVIIPRIVAPGGKIICIGDENQAVMGFRGAENDAMDQIIAMLGADVLPLPVCRRNSKAVCRLVNETFPDIRHEVLDSAPEGHVDLEFDGKKLHAMVRPGDMVLCRTNAPLVKPAFELIRRGIKAIIVGRSLHDEIVNLLERVQKNYGVYDLSGVLAALEEYRNKEVESLLKRNKENSAQALIDRVETVFVLADGCEAVEQIIDKANTIFSDKIQGVVFSSVHRSKGLEADRVFIIRYDLMPHPMAKKPWALVQERNLKFVALTRSKLDLFLVS